MAAGMLAVVVVVTVLSTRTRSSTKPLLVVRGVVSSEEAALFRDPRVAAAFARHGLDVQFETVGAGQVATAVGSSQLDFAFLAGAPAAARLSTVRHTTASVPFFTPMAVATFRDIAQLLARIGVAHDHGGWWTLDIKRYLDLVHRHVRWNQLPGNSSYPATRPVLIASDGITTNAAAMYASLASYAATNGTVVSSPEQVDTIVNAVSPLFVEQGRTYQSSESSFDDYVSIGESTTPMVMIDEAQFVARAAAPDGHVQPNMVLMYPDPDILSRQTFVPLTPTGDRVGHLLTDDPTLQRVAVESGFRTTVKPDALGAFARQNHVAVPPNLLNVIEPPAYANLDALMVRINAALVAASGPSASPPITNETVTTPALDTGPHRTGKP